MPKINGERLLGDLRRIADFSTTRIQPTLSYGGVKTSGIGKEASLESMLEHFTHKKTIIFNMK